MTVIESIVQGVQNLPLRPQVEVARYVHRLSASVQQRRTEVLRRLHGVLDEADGLAFEQAMNGARRLEAHG
jgi:conjugal transfer/entry exclusion protein